MKHHMEPVEIILALLIMVVSWVVHIGINIWLAVCPGNHDDAAVKGRKTVRPPTWQEMVEMWERAKS